MYRPDWWNSRLRRGSGSIPGHYLNFGRPVEFQQRQLLGDRNSGRPPTGRGDFVGSRFLFASNEKRKITLTKTRLPGVTGGYARQA